MKKILNVVVLIFSLSTAAWAQQEVFTKSGEAIRGYDPVAYFKEGKPVKGKDEFKYTWKSVEWKFSSEQNLKDFAANPEQYAPQFGGYCSYGVADGHKAPTQPDAWTIVDGKLYLNYNLDVKKIWSEKQAEYIATANKTWAEVKKQKD
ncbi:MAG: YHS domain-containing (seleno)protein [Bacteroidota bacterium]